MKLKRTDILITEEQSKFKIYIRKKIFWFVHAWVELTQQETENSDEQPVEFDNIKAAREFANLITE